MHDCIPKAFCSLSYITEDHAIHTIVQFRTNTLFSNVNIKSAFHLILIHPTDRYLLVMKWKDKIYTDTCLPFWAMLFPKLFSILADLVPWITEQEVVLCIIHYTDDFLIIPPSLSSMQPKIKYLYSTVWQS